MLQMDVAYLGNVIMGSLVAIENSFGIIFDGLALLLSPPDIGVAIVPSLFVSRVSLRYAAVAVVDLLLWESSRFLSIVVVDASDDVVFFVMNLCCGVGPA